MACRLLCQRATFRLRSVAKRDLRAQHGLNSPTDSAAVSGFFAQIGSAPPNVRRGDLRDRQQADDGVDVGRNGAFPLDSSASHCASPPAGLQCYCLAAAEKVTWRASSTACATFSAGAAGRSDRRRDLRCCGALSVTISRARPVSTGRPGTEPHLPRTTLDHVAKGPAPPCRHLEPQTVAEAMSPGCEARSRLPDPPPVLPVGRSAERPIVWPCHQILPP